MYDEDVRRLMAAAAFNGGSCVHGGGSVLGCDDVRLRGGGKTAGAKRKTQTQQSNLGGDMRLWRQVAAAGAVAAALSAAVVAGGYGGDGRLWRRRKEQR